MICIWLGEVFPAAAGAFFSAKMMFLRFYDMYKAWLGLPGCRRPFLFSYKNDWQIALAIFVIVEAPSQKGPAFAKGFVCSQFVTQSIHPQWGGGYHSPSEETTLNVLWSLAPTSSFARIRSSTHWVHLQSSNTNSNCAHSSNLHHR